MHCIELEEWISELGFADICFLKNLLPKVILFYISYREFWESREKINTTTTTNNHTKNPLHFQPLNLFLTI